MAKDKERDSGLSPEIERLSAQLARDTNSKLFIPLAEEYMKSDMPEEAIMTLEEGLKAHPAYMSARVLLGKAYLAKGEMEKACEQFEKVIKAVPDNLFALRKLGEIYIAQGRREEALRNLRILALLSPKDDELTGLIKRLESGELPPSPIAMPKPAPEAGPEMPATAQAPAIQEPSSVQAVDFDLPEAEDEPLEGSAPVYEIDEEAAGGFMLEEESPLPAVQEPAGFGQELGEGIPEPAIEQPSPFGMAEDVLFEPGEARTLDLDAGLDLEEDAGGGGFIELEPLGGSGQAGEASAAPVTRDTGMASGDELQDIFSSYGGEAVEETSEPGTGVYEIEEPSDLDLAELGVKSSMAPAGKSAIGSAEIHDDMPFEVEGEADLTVPEGTVFGMEQDLDVHPFSLDEETPSSAPSQQEAPFDIGGEDVSPFEEAFASEALGMEPAHETGLHDAGGMFDIEPEAEALPFGMDVGFEPHEPQAEPFGTAGDFGSTETEVSPFELMAAEPEPGPAAPVEGFEPQHAHEPINTETLAEMYIRQGFYDRAIGIYKELLRESPGDAVLKQKLDELYMLAGISSTRAASSNALEAAAQATIEPADFVQAGEAVLEEPEFAGPVFVEAVKHETPSPSDTGDVVVRLEQFLETIKRKGRQ